MQNICFIFVFVTEKNWSDHTDENIWGRLKWPNAQESRWWRNVTVILRAVVEVAVAHQAGISRYNIMAGRFRCLCLPTFDSHLFGCNAPTCYLFSVCLLQISTLYVLCPAVWLMLWWCWFVDSGVGAGIDSYYEYLLKAYIMLGDETYLDRFNKVLLPCSRLISVWIDCICLIYYVKVLYTSR